MRWLCGSACKQYMQYSACCVQTNVVSSNVTNHLKLGYVERFLDLITRVDLNPSVLNSVNRLLLQSTLLGRWGPLKRSGRKISTTSCKGHTLNPKKKVIPSMLFFTWFSLVPENGVGYDVGSTITIVNAHQDHQGFFLVVWWWLVTCTNPHK